MVNIYQKIAEELAKNPQTNAFEVEERLGREETRRVIAEKKKDEGSVAKNPRYADYPYVAHRREIEKIAGVKAETPPEEVGADFAIPCFMLAKEKKMSPANIAEEISETIQNARLPFVESATVAGGYVNVKLHDDAFAQGTLKAVIAQKETYGASQEGKGKTIVIEYSSPNAAKPMSVGHLRSTIIGESLKRIYEFQGYTVVGINHFGDFGTQFGKLLVAEARWRDDISFRMRPVKEMLRLYVKFHEEAKKDEALEDEARALFKKIEEGDAGLLQKWAAFCAISAADFQKTYDALGIAIDLTLGESFYQVMLADTSKRLNSLTKEEVLGRGFDVYTVINADKSVAALSASESFPSFLVKKRDESSLYSTRDIAAAEFRLKEFSPEKIIYVVGGEQTLHFRQVFATLESLGYESGKFQHDGFGLVSLPEGKMSTREGRVIFLEDLLKEAKERALAVVSEKSPALSDTEKNEIADAVGTGAVVYNDLSQSRERDIVFDWKKAMSMEGSSAPYIQYGYARAMHILKKAGETPAAESIANVKITTEREAKLVRRIARFPEVIQECTASDHPHILATYLNALVQDFGRFYNEDTVLNAEGDVKTTRLLLVAAVAQVIKNGLQLLGIRTLERM